MSKSETGSPFNATHKVNFGVKTLSTMTEKMSQLLSFRGASFSIKGFMMGQQRNTCQLLNHLHLILHSRAFLQHTCLLSQGRREQEGCPLSTVITEAAPAATPTH